MQIQSSVIESLILARFDAGNSDSCGNLNDASLHLQGGIRRVALGVVITWTLENYNVSDLKTTFFRQFRQYVCLRSPDGCLRMIEAGLGMLSSK